MKMERKIKVANITIMDPVNIGNRLQNYAVQELLKNKGCIVDTLYYYVADESTKSKILSYIACVLRKLGIYGSNAYIKYIEHNNKMRLAKKFNDNYISLEKKYILKLNKRKKMLKCVDDYDFYCVGSDQVWNAALVQNNSFFFMDFAESKRTFSLSASMGTAYIPDKYLDTYINGLKHVGNISVREEDAKEYIKQLIDRESVVLLDPTLLISSEKWDVLGEKPKFHISKKYIVTYFLGPLSDTQKKYIDEYAKLNDYEIIEMNGKFKDYVGPSEFIYLISNSEFVFTDSFHGTAFSIIFNKSFIVFQRNNSYDMSSRIITVLNKFDIMDHFYNKENNDLPEDFLDYVKKIENSNYNIKLKLDEEKSKADRFINRSLNMEDK